MTEIMASRLACHPCRDRKVKCSKELPSCSNCQSCRRRCAYPSAMLKPGPKLGTTFKRRSTEKRPAERHYQKSPKRSKIEIPQTKQRVCVAATQECRDSDDAAQMRSKQIQCLSCLIHPSHEQPFLERLEAVKKSKDSSCSKGDVIWVACESLGLPLDSVKPALENFFKTYTTFSLFRRPAFFAKLGKISSVLQMKALISIVLAFAGRGVNEQPSTGSASVSASAYGDLARGYIEEAIEECGDEVPPLCLLQTLILVTHWMMIKGVRGRAWRALGLCIRILFELELHNMDADKVGRRENACIDVDQWCQDEERRRAYWAIWELELFAAIIKQQLMTLDWTQHNVLLPVEDDRWFQGQPRPSCFVEADSTERPKALQATGSESASAWAVVLQTLVAEAHSLSLARQKAIRPSERTGPAATPTEQKARGSQTNVATLLNSIQLCLLLMPQRLRFQSQMLDFGTQALHPSMIPTAIHRHSEIYNLAVISEMARLIALTPCVFEKYVRSLDKRGRTNPRWNGERQRDAVDDGLDRELQHCFNASDAVLDVLVSSCNGHYAFVNPCLWIGLWLAAIVQLFKRELTDHQAEKIVFKSQYEILKTTNERFSQHWEMSPVPLQSLNALSVRLNQLTANFGDAAQAERTTSAGLQNLAETSTGLSSIESKPDPSGFHHYRSFHSEGPCQAQRARLNRIPTAAEDFGLSSREEANMYPAQLMGQSLCDSEPQQSMQDPRLAPQRTAECSFQVAMSQATESSFASGAFLESLDLPASSTYSNQSTWMDTITAPTMNLDSELWNWFLSPNREMDG